MALAISEVRELIKRAFARQDMLDACARRDLGAIITILAAHGITQGQIAELTGIGQGRLSEWARHKRSPQASSTFESFADGLGMPPAARQALGLAPGPSVTPGLNPGRHAGGRVTAPARTPPAAARPVSPRPAGTSLESLADLQGLEAVQKQLDDVIAVLAAEQGRRRAGSVVRRRAWKNLVFAGGAGCGKSRTAVAVGQAYRKLGVLATGHVLEVAAADLVGSGPGETGTLVAEAVRPASGGILMITAAHDWGRLPDHGLQMLRCLYQRLTDYRNEMGDELAVILAGDAAPLRDLLHAHPSLAARFRAVIDFPGYTPGQLAAIFGALAGEAGLTLAPGAARKAAVVLARTEAGHGSGNARLAVRLLNQATAVHARRVAAQGPGAPNTIIETDIPEHLRPGDGTASDGDWPGQYL